MLKWGGIVPNAAKAQQAGPIKIIEALHADCSKAIKASSDAKYDQLNAASYGLATDLDLWGQLLSHRTEFPLYETASSEFLLALLNNSQGQYRNAFKGIRLVLELISQGVYLSTNLVILTEWLTSQADTSWQTILDPDKGVFALRFCRAFFPALSDDVATIKVLAQTLYREMSECTHGNVPNKIPLPKKIEFDEATFSLWHEKVLTLRLIVNFVFAMRYLNTFDRRAKGVIRLMLLDELGHLESIRQMLEGAA